jgi:multisubunit Na+/H+ antiporter MnhG subunit
MKMKNVFSTAISKNQARDTGMAIVLILLLVAVFSLEFIYVKIAILALVITMTIPLVYKYIAVIWFGLSHLLGTFVSKLLLTVVFFLVVAPVGWIRRVLGYDSLKLKEFKRGTESVMQVRNITFSKNDIDKPF